MKIVVINTPTSWTDFEKQEWPEVDKDHYGKALDWSKKLFLIEGLEKDKMVGALRMEIEVGVAYVNAIIVSKNKRGKGIGMALMEKAEEIARKNGAHKIHLITGKTWGTVVFYKRLGYKVAAQLPNHHFHVDFVDMTKFLDA